MHNKIKGLTIFTILLILVVVGTLMAYADGPSTQPDAVRGEVIDTAVITIDTDNQTAQSSEKRGEVVDRKVVSIPAAEGVGASSINWEVSSTLRYVDHGEWEEVQGRSENSTSEQVYRLDVHGKLLHNGNQVWDNLVSNCCNVTSVSSGNSPWFTGFNAFWQSKGDHWLWQTSGSNPVFEPRV